MKIVIGSILKPLDDTRHYHKLALSISKQTEAHIYIFARQVSYLLPVLPNNCTLKALVPVRVSLLHRLLAPLKLGFYLLKVKPQVIISCTHELLIVITAYKILFGCQIIYDVQENYGENILCNARFSSIVKKALAKWIRKKEALLTPFIDTFWLAERCYATELPFPTAKSVILENKSLYYNHRSRISLQGKSILRLVFTGTIARETGVFEAIALVERLNSLDPCYQLLISGCCHQQVTKNELEALAKSKDYIHLYISDAPISYSEIQKTLLSADIGVISYLPQRNFINKLPTKLFEYITMSLPMIAVRNSLWEEICKGFDSSIFIDFKNANPVPLHELLQTKVFYPEGNVGAKQYCWGIKEESLILSSLKSCQKRHNTL